MPVDMKDFALLIKYSLTNKGCVLEGLDIAIIDPPPCNMMGYPMLEIFSSAPPEVITTFYVPRKVPQQLYVMCIFLFKLFFQFLNSWWVFSNEGIRFEEEIALAVICVSLDGIIKK